MAETVLLYQILKKSKECLLFSFISGILDAIISTAPLADQKQ